MEQIKVDQVLSGVFSTHTVKIENNIVYGQGLIGDQSCYILGTIEAVAFGVIEAFTFADKLIDIMNSGQPPLPIIMLVDVAGQKLAVEDEWMGMYAYFAHLLQTLELMRANGYPLFSLVYNQAIGGSFIAFGLMADRIYALSHAQVAVMWIEAMARVTKIDEEKLREVSKSSPVFAPGVENFKMLGGLHEVLELDQVAKQILQDLQDPELNKDKRALLAKQYGGRKYAYDIIEKLTQL